MRVILWVTLALGALWGGYWVVGSQAVERTVLQWFADQTAQGVTATKDGVSVAGFPSRFDLTVTNPHLADPATGWGWKAPFVQVLAMTWKPWHVIAALPNDQQIIAPGQMIALTSSKLQASLRLAPTGGFALQELVVEGHDLRATSDLGWSLGAKTMVAAVAPDGTTAGGLRLGLQVADLAVDALLAAKVPQLGALASVVHLDATVVLDPPMEQATAEAPSKVTSITLADFHMTWGELGITGKGQVAASATGQAEGKIDFAFKNWRTIPALIVALGLVQPGMGTSITGGLEALAKSGPDPAVLELSLVFAGGRMSFGPLPLGPAPQMN